MGRGGGKGSGFRVFGGRGRGIRLGLVRAVFGWTLCRRVRGLFRAQGEQVCQPIGMDI